MMAKPARKIVVSIRKGGAGKTTTAVNLASGLMQRGKRVLFLDLDSQSNAAKALGVVRDPQKPSVREVLSGQVSNLRDAIVPVTWPTFAPGLALDLIPSHSELANTEMGMAVQTALTQLGMGDQRDNTMQSIANLLRALEDDYDYIIMDTSTNPGLLSLAAMSAADDVIIPYAAGAFNDDGLYHAFATIRNVQEQSNPALNIHGILVTKHDNTTYSKERDQALETYAAHVYPFKVPRRTIYDHTNDKGVPIAVFAPGDEAAEAYIKLVELLISEQ